MMLRGYDEYEVTLGDEMRGERASLGRTLIDAENDLRIKANVIRAIEDCDLDGFPNDSVVAGYVRSYARYLGLDAEECYQRFCAESGFRRPISALGGFSHAGSFDRSAHNGGLQDIVAAGAALGTGLTQSRFAVKSGPVRMSARISLGGLTSVFAMLGLIIGLGYGGYGLLQDIQRVRVAPLPDAPEVVVEAPTINAPSIEGGLLRRPDAEAYNGDGALAAATPPDLLPPPLPSRDGPISAIDPATSGVFRDGPRGSEQMSSTGAAEVSAGDTAMFVAPIDPVPAVAAIPSGPPTIVVHATDTAWIRVNDGDAAIIFEGTLAAGNQFEIPARVTAPLLRTGNAGAVYVLVGEAAYGPVGGSGRIVSNLSLLAGDIETLVPEASADAIGTVPGEHPSQRAEAVVSQ